MIPKGTFCKSSKEMNRTSNELRISSFFNCKLLSDAGTSEMHSAREAKKSKSDRRYKPILELPRNRVKYSIGLL